MKLTLDLKLSRILSLLALKGLFCTAFAEVYEAEGIREPDALVLQDPQASRAQYATASHDGGSIAKIDIPANQQVEVWARYRGLPLMLKAPDGKMVGSLEGAGAVDGGWHWGSFGVFTGDRVGSRLELFMPFAPREVEGPGGDAPPHKAPSGVDMVVVTAPGKELPWLNGHIQKTTDFTLPDADVVMELASKSEPESGEAGSALITVDWAAPTVRTSGRQFSLNVFGGFDPAVATDPRYRQNMEYMAPGTLRYHCMSLVRDPAKVSKSWLNDDLRTWNREKIGAALDALPAEKFERVITIGKWPDWMDADNDGLLDRENYDAFVELCADLVRIVNVEQKRNVRFFEITNERDITYWLAQMKSRTPPRTAELARLYNLCARAMKGVDPTIKTGGPAACRGDMLEPLKQFAILTLGNLDFFSYHAYASGRPSESDE